MYSPRTPGFLSLRLSNTEPPLHMLPFRSHDKRRFERLRTGMGPQGPKSKLCGFNDL